MSKTEDKGNWITMDPAERQAMEEMEWSRGFDDEDRPEGSHAQDDEVMRDPKPDTHS